MTDYIIPEVTLEEADTITLDNFASPQTLESFTERIRLILTEDRRRVASLQDPWVEVPRGAVIPAGVRHRLVREYAEPHDWDTGDSQATTLVRRSDLPKVTSSKPRHERIIDEVMKTIVWPNGPMCVQHLATAGEWLAAIEAAVKVVDGDE